MNLPVRNLMCLRDPNFEKHEGHAGHISRIKNSSPKEDYENRKRHKRAGGKANVLIRHVEHYCGMKITQTQRDLLLRNIRDELFLISKNPDWL